MIISVNWLKKFTDINLPIDKLATLIGARLVEIESVTDLGAKYKDVTVARIIECGPLEGTDHLNLTKIDDGGVIKDVERDDKGLVQVVCGAPNVRAGMLVAWLPPGSTVPESFGGSEPFVLAAKSLRGKVSSGMLASAKELDLFDEHTGILEIDKELEVGSNFALAYELNDYLLDIENKSLTHRPDTFGIIGFAREIAAITGNAFVTPEWLAEVEPLYGDKFDELKAPIVIIDDPTLAARYQAVILSGADGTRQSPLEVQTYLSRVGVRPINAVVDVTNYLMMLTGQPLHAFDYDKLLDVSGGKAEIHVRTGKAGEKLALLDGRTIELTPEDIVIAAGEIPIGLAGAMGGANTIIDETTKNIIIESATFNLYNLRATQMRHGIFSEAITRFTKGQPPALTAPVLAEAIDLLGQWASAKRVSDVTQAKGDAIVTAPITITSDQINQILGTVLTLDEVEATLRSAEFAVAAVEPTSLSVDPPYWRADIHILQDVVEEIGRLRGFDSIMPTLPARDFSAIAPSIFDDLRTQLRRLLVRAGANEVLSYSFIHRDILTKAGQKPEDSYKITNSISPDLQYYRQTLTPSLLSFVHPNVKQGYDNFALFEMNKTHQKAQGLTNENVPKEIGMLALTITNKKSQSGAAYYQAKRLLDFVGESLGLELVYSSLETSPDSPESAPFEYRRSAIVSDKQSGVFVGIVGEYNKSVIKAFKLPTCTAGFEINTNALLTAFQKVGPAYIPLSRYPSTERDVCFQVADSISYAQITAAAKIALAAADLQTQLAPIDIYQPEDGKTKNITLRIKLTADDHTLTSNEITTVINSVIAIVVSATQAKVI